MFGNESLCRNVWILSIVVAQLARNPIIHIDVHDVVVFHAIDDVAFGFCDVSNLQPQRAAHASVPNTAWLAVAAPHTNSQSRANESHLNARILIPWRIKITWPSSSPGDRNASGPLT
jgi:hypothetical protein